MTLIAIPLLLLALAGVGYTVAAAIVVGRVDAPQSLHVAPEPATLLKPLHGAEPRLAENLATFLDQDWDAPIEMICGVQRADDPARGVIASLKPLPFRGGVGGGGVTSSASLGDGPHPNPSPEGEGLVSVVEVLDPTTHGANAKIANLINMMPAASHDLLVLSDSDMVAPRDYLRRIAGALAQPGVGAVTCLWRGRGDAGFWSRLCAGSISYGFLPALCVNQRLGMRQACMGSTIALRRDTLARIGGFEAFADMLADDYAIGEAVNALGLKVAIPSIVLAHGFTERSLAALWRHELRWAATTRALVPTAYVGTIAFHPLPLALLAMPFAPLTGLGLTMAALAARAWLKRRVDRRCGAATFSLWLLPPRDMLSFAVFVASFFVRSVDWRGARLTMERDRRKVRTQGVPGL